MGEAHYKLQLRLLLTQTYCVLQISSKYRILQVYYNSSLSVELSSLFREQQLLLLDDWFPTNIYNVFHNIWEAYSTTILVTIIK